MNRGYGRDDWKHHKHNPSQPPFSSSFSRQQSGSIVTVKVENLAKVTQEFDLRERLKDFKITSLKVIYCSDAPVNYAWVNCVDQATAQGVVEAVHERMLLHQNRLTAKIKGQSRPYSASSAVAQPAPQVAKDICDVKILIFDHLTATNVDLHFKQYGELSCETIVRKGGPDYAHVNFIDPSSAHKARINSPHIIQGVHVVALPYKATGSSAPVNPMEGLLTLEFSCKPLALAAAKKEIQREFTIQQMMKFDVRWDKFIVHVNVTIATLVKNRIENIIANHESKIETKDLLLEFYYLPVLADLEVQKFIHDIKLPAQIRISRGAQKAELGELAMHYNNRKKGQSELATLNQYLTPSSPERSGKHQWYWTDDDAIFQPYTEKVSDQIEKKFVERDRYKLRIGIGMHNYTIDTSSMAQTNQKTRKKRKIKREPLASSDVSNKILLHITAYQDHTSEIKREIVDILSKSIEEATVQLPTIATSVKPFAASLLDTARQNYIQATLEQDGLTTMVLKGKHLLVKSTEVELQAEILKKERAMEKMTRMSVPENWEPQVKKCELKLVTKGSSEWNEISDKMQKPNFKVDIEKIERIQNTWLWETYQMSKKRMSDKNDGIINEMKLFHGPRENKPKDIYDSEQGFDHRLASPGLFGEGTYFAVESSYSHKYAYKPTDRYKLHSHAYSTAGHTHQLFLVNVITGVPCKCSTHERTLKAPPKKSDRRYQSKQGPTSPKFEGERFDSVCGKSNGSEIYVIYELGRVYPAYLISYTVNRTMDQFF